MTPLSEPPALSSTPSLRLARKLERITTAWTTFAPEESFAEMTLSEFIEATSASGQSRETIGLLNSIVRGGIARRMSADAGIRPLIRRAVAGVISEPGFGPDSPLYRAMGYVCSNERKTGTPGTPADPGCSKPKATRDGVMEHHHRITIAWGEIAPDASFAGMSLGQFTQATAASAQARSDIALVRANHSAEIARRTHANSLTLDLIKRVVSGVKAARRFGDNSPLYRAMGYKPANERLPYRRRTAGVSAEPGQSEIQVAAPETVVPLALASALAAPKPQEEPVIPAQGGSALLPAASQRPATAASSLPTTLQSSGSTNPVPAPEAPLEGIPPWKAKRTQEPSLINPGSQIELREP